MKNQKSSENQSSGKNKTRPLAVVTGASSGIGYELAKVFAKNNFDLLVVAEDAGIADAGNAFRQLGCTVETLQTNLAHFKGVDSLRDKIKSMGRPIDSVAINAGVGVGGKFIETELADEINLIQLNIVSVVHLTKHVLKDMVDQGYGRILITSSVAAEMPGPYYAVYAASKAFVQSFSEAIREEVKDTGVSITALQPGATDTNFFARAGLEDTKAGGSKKASPADVAQVGFDAMMSGKDHVIEGFMNKIQVGVSKFATQATAAKLQGSFTKPTE